MVENWHALGEGPYPLLLFFTTILTKTVVGINSDLTTDKPASNYVNYGMV